MFEVAFSGYRAMLDNVSEEIPHCYLKAEECKERAKTAFDAEAIARFLAMEQNWLDLAQSYENTQRLARFIPFRRNE